jgi:hypothetical protein
MKQVPGEAESSRVRVAVRGRLGKGDSFWGRLGSALAATKGAGAGRPRMVGVGGAGRGRRHRLEVEGGGGRGRVRAAVVCTRRRPRLGDDVVGSTGSVEVGAERPEEAVASGSSAWRW